MALVAYTLSKKFAWDVLTFVGTIIVLNGLRAIMHKLRKPQVPELTK